MKVKKSSATNKSDTRSSDITPPEKNGSPDNVAITKSDNKVDSKISSAVTDTSSNTNTAANATSSQDGKGALGMLGNYSFSSESDSD